jgi:hypothetical protein
LPAPYGDPRVLVRDLLAYSSEQTTRVMTSVMAVNLQPSSSASPRRRAAPFYDGPGGHLLILTCHEA